MAWREGPERGPRAWRASEGLPRDLGDPAESVRAGGEAPPADQTGLAPSGGTALLAGANAPCATVPGSEGQPQLPGRLSGES
jgi:hypothetical protein